MTTTVEIIEPTTTVTVEETEVTVEITEQTTTVEVATGVTDHGALTGLSDNDHPQYALATALDTHEADTDNPHEVTAAQTNALPLTGGTLTGPLTLDDDPTEALHAATKQYVDAQGGGGASDIGELEAAGFAEDDFAQWDGAAFVNRTPAQVLADIGAAASGHNHDASYVNVTGDTMTGDLSLAGDALSATIRRIDFVNDSSVVARIEAFNVSGSNKQNAELVFSTSLNGSFAEVLRLPRPNSNIVFTRPISLVDGNTVFERTGAGNLRVSARIDIGLYSALFSQNYAYFSRDGTAYIAPRTANTNTIAAVLQLRHNTGNTPAAGFGASLDITLESSTTEDRNAARIAAVWTTATDASRKADLVLSAYDTAEREGLRIRATGSAALLITSLPTSDPAVAGALWSDGGTVKVSSG